jgi:hypothetical protein
LDAVKGLKKPNTAGSEYNAMQFMIKQAIGGQIHTAIPVRVQAVDGLFVDVLPLVTQIDGYGEAVSPTTLFHLPVFRYHAGVAAVIVNPVVGDIGLAVFAQSDSSNVNEGITDPQQPGSFRRFSMSDGFYFGGFHNAEPSVFIEVEQSGVVNIQANTVNISGDCNIGGISFLNHTHTGVHGETSPPH